MPAAQRQLATLYLERISIHVAQSVPVAPQPRSFCWCLWESSRPARARTQGLHQGVEVLIGSSIVLVERGKCRVVPCPGVFVAHRQRPATDFLFFESMIPVRILLPLGFECVASFLPMKECTMYSRGLACIIIRVQRQRCVDMTGRGLCCWITFLMYVSQDRLRWQLEHSC